MKTFDVQSIGIEAPRSHVFVFVAEPGNLPKWASAFKRADARSARLLTPQGAVTIGLKTDARPDAGTVDWTMTFPDGSVGTAYARVRWGEQIRLLLCAHGAARTTSGAGRRARRAAQDPRGGAHVFEDDPRSKMIKLDPDLVAAARQGSRAALKALVLALQRPIFKLAMRMLANRPDAEDAMQEILIKVITHLGDVQDVEAAGAWAFRIACRHLVHARKQGRVEAQRLTFRAFAADLAEGLEELPDEAMQDPETQVLIEEVKIGCTLALLTCLSRPLRAAYILGEIFEMSDTEAAEALEIDQAAFRQRLRRGRALVTRFVQTRCGIVSPAAACRCDRRVAQAVRLGRAERGRPSFSTQEPLAHSVAQVRASIARLERGRAAVALMRSNPEFTTEVGRLVLQVMDAD